MQVPWLERLNLASLYVVRAVVVHRLDDVGGHLGDDTGAVATTTSPASTAARYSMPVPTRGDSLG